MVNIGEDKYWRKEVEVFQRFVKISVRMQLLIIKKVVSAIYFEGDENSESWYFTRINKFVKRKLIWRWTYPNVWHS